eukprot:TRINITY_DN1805_c0_g1_i3.p1 TRINITY_DN1805_c0_g1~~TRINITY_DN1805_c0_g1_i3.p1  ORF type:complete len:306 (-),score=94.30 TRINITY_DN1805_c0_g1_i3:819-1736(-)
MNSSPEKRKGEQAKEMESEAGQNNKLPKITELMAPNELPPAAFSTTIPEVTTVQEGQITNTIPSNSQIVVPVLPECVPLIAEVPDVVPENNTKPKQSENLAKEEVKISQVLPGYAPSYASDYVPSEVDKNSYNSFVNTLSFNVSRYPTLTEITQSKDYQKEEEKKKLLETAEDAENKKKTFDYVPAEYLTGQDTKLKKAKASQSMCAVVKPEVLSSGRVLTTMSLLGGEENPDRKEEGTENGEEKKEAQGEEKEGQGEKKDSGDKTENVKDDESESKGDESTETGKTEDQNKQESGDKENQTAKS